MLLALFPMSLIKNIAEQMKKYVYDDWVVEEEEKGRNGNTKKIKVLVQCKENREGVRHHVEEDKQNYDVTPGIIIACHGILIITGDHFSGTRRGHTL